MMPLVEIVRHDAMDAATEQRLAAFCRSIDKLPVPVAGTPGFLVNRILMPYLLEAITCHSEGIPGPVIDRAFSFDEVPAAYEYQNRGHHFGKVVIDIF